MRRRQFLGVLSGAALWPFAVRSQGTAAPLIGFLSPSTNSADYVEGFFAGLRELGYVDRRNIRIESRWADGKLDQLPKLAAELVRLNVNVLVTSVTEATLQAKKATATIPIVLAAVGDPVAAGLVASPVQAAISPARPACRSISSASRLSCSRLLSRAFPMQPCSRTRPMPHIRRFSCEKRNMRHASPGWNSSW
jgi:hypothetical protein